MTGVSVLAALLIDRWIGEVERGHPLVLFGGLAQRVEVSTRQMLAPANRKHAILAGALGWGVLVIVPTVLLAIVQSLVGELPALLLGVLVLYFCIGLRSLAEHARAVAGPLAAGDLECARQAVSRIVSRDTTEMDEASVTRAAVESVLENGSDAVLAPIFWFAVAGAPGALGYRLANTLDAMWGYRNDRYRDYGYVAARLDDLLNWVPARLCALSYALVGRFRTALFCWQAQAPLCDSPNGGPVMSAGAGALGIRLGGVTPYGDGVRFRPQLGEGEPAQRGDIERALQLLWRATALWVGVIVIGDILVCD